MSLERATLEERFWSKVWRCTHKHPCKRCCWPWQSVDVTVNWKYAWEQHPIFSYRDEGTVYSLPAQRCAYELAYGLVLFKGHGVHLCHQCHFGPCCNFAHIRPGSASDNSRDKRHSRSRPRIIRLPDGRIWDFRAACAAQDAFYDARGFLHVFAGPVHPHFDPLLPSLNHPDLLWIPWSVCHALGTKLDQLARYAATRA